MCVYSFSVSFEKTDRIMSIFLCVLTRTEKSSNFSVGFRIFLSGFLKRTEKIRIFCVYREKRTEKFISHRSIRVSSSDVLKNENGRLFDQLKEEQAKSWHVLRWKLIYVVIKVMGGG